MAARKSDDLLVRRSHGKKKSRDLLRAMISQLSNNIISFMPKIHHTRIKVVATAIFLFVAIACTDVTVSPEVDPKKGARIVVLKGFNPGIMQEYCLAAISDDPYKGSKLKIAACKGGDEKQLFLVDKNRWRLAADPTLCVDSNQTRMGASLYLQKCKGGEIGNERQKWRFGSMIRADARWGMCPALAIGTLLARCLHAAPTKANYFILRCQHPSRERSVELVRIYLMLKKIIFAKSERTDGANFMSIIQIPMEIARTTARTTVAVVRDRT